MATEVEDDGDEERDTSSDDAGGGIAVAVVAISATRSLSDDPAATAVIEAVESTSHELTTRERIQKDHDNVQGRISSLVDRSDVEVVVTVGGAGISPDDVTLEAIRPLLDKDLSAFADVFHRLSYEERGTSEIGRRVLGGVADGVVLFCLPGSEDAARLAVDEIIVPEAKRLARLATETEAEREGESEHGADGDPEP